MAVSPEEAGAEAARYLDLDPGLFLEQAALAGMVVCTDGKLLNCGCIGDDFDEPDRVRFLWTLMRKSGGGRWCGSS